MYLYAKTGKLRNWWKTNGKSKVVPFLTIVKFIHVEGTSHTLRTNCTGYVSYVAMYVYHIFV